MTTRTSRVGLAALLVVLAGCSSAPDQQPAAGPSSRATTEAATQHPPSHAAPPADVALREGERRARVAVPEPYRPAAPTAAGSDDYRCFLLDPGLARDGFVTGTHVAPGNPASVHHVILFQVPPEEVEDARSVDRATPGQGWTCFGGSGLDAGAGPQSVPWLGAWTPGSGESVLREGYGVPVPAGTQLVMQVHYNLLAGDQPDATSVELRVADGAAGLTPVTTMLLPAPVELPCRPEHDDAPLCDREAALDDVRVRFGTEAGSAAEWLRGTCPGSVPGPQQSCTRTLTRSGTIIGVAGHMHLLGRSIRVELNPGTPRARTLLDVPSWSFDDQGALAVEPVAVRPGDEVRVTCEHSQELRDVVPALRGQPDRYVLWGEGSTDEMCVGLLQVGR